jgi:gluconate 5-dehydrogenase
VPPRFCDLSGQSALITGSGRGLGLAIAIGLAAAGAHVILNGRRAGPLQAAADQICSAGGRADIAVFDIADAAAVEAAMAEDALSAAGAPGGVDILVNNVGQRRRGALDALTLSEARALVDVDLLAPFALARLAAAGMTAKGYGRILNITSIAGPIAQSGDAVYTMAKGGLEALTRALAADLGPHGITVNAIAPGFFATEANAELAAQAEIKTWLERRTAVGRWGRPEEIAGAAVFLASREASYVTGHVLAVDGGYLSHF